MVPQKWTFYLNDLVCWRESHTAHCSWYRNSRLIWTIWRVRVWWSPIGRFCGSPCDTDLDSRRGRRVWIRPFVLGIETSALVCSRRLSRLSSRSRFSWYTVSAIRPCWIYIVRVSFRAVVYWIAFYAHLAVYFH